MQRFASFRLVPLFGLLVLVFSGCSQEEGAFIAPAAPTPESSFNDSPPAMPSGLCVMKGTDRGFSLSWTPNREGDLAGYRVYVYDPSPYRPNSYRCPHGTTLIDPADARYLYTEDTAWGPHYFMIAAIDDGGNESSWYGPLEYVYAGPDTAKDYDELDPDPSYGGGNGAPGTPWQAWEPGRDEYDKR